MSWETTQTGEGVVQVIPLQDELPHLKDIEWESLPFDDAPVSLCSCGARREVSEKGMWIIIHQSFDGREGIEWTTEILSGK